jgi:PPK2 family polyphosphate:nucleotide phosphotransferase
MKHFNLNDYLVDSKINLNAFPTRLKGTMTKGVSESSLKQLGLQLSELQDKMYAHNKYSVLVCIQGMDTAGKDSLIREVFRHFNPRGVVVHSFKTPTRRELQHDYLWRHYRALPERGKYGVFNRSHYENVLITRVNPELILKEKLPWINQLEDITEEFWQNRLEQIRSFEQHIAQNGTIIFKFFLHISKEEQRQRLLRRLEKEKHQWKFLPSDITERALWDDYIRYYEEAIGTTSFPHAPWYIIPADDRLTARYLVARIILETMQTFTNIQEPALAPEIKANLEYYIELLNKKEL